MKKRVDLADRNLGDIIDSDLASRPCCAEIVRTNAQKGSVQPKRDQTIKIGNRENK